ncbi:DNA polymerase III subunit gamma and tau [Ornithinimicrobium sp. Arc0846-15]|nr:DNA polymerase III subunit gamma and tau [Ornithinimicrobium laminariae]
MSTALYRRYRPETFADVIGQEHVTEPLIQALKTGRVNHAYLFSGPRGCGKTTSARILARCLNCEQGPTATPCGVCESCVALARGGSGSIDVIEIDAASHGGVDDARDLRERAAFGPAQSRYKVYIIDEAHMVTSHGFNALLKVVEEPPEHVKFIFATTEPEKVLATIRSRTHHYPFHLVPPQRLTSYLEELCEAEGVSLEPGVLSFVTRAGGGSVRDSLSVLDQLISGAGDEGLTYERTAALLGFTDTELLDAVVEAVAATDSATTFAQVDRVMESGHDPRRFIEDLLERYRDLIVLLAVGDRAGGLLPGLPADQVERMRRQAGSYGPSALTHSADVVSRGLAEMTGAVSYRLVLELTCARLLLPTAAGEQGYAARLDRIERRLSAGGPAPTATLEQGRQDRSAPTSSAPEQPVAAQESANRSTPAPTSSAAPNSTPAPSAQPATEHGSSERRRSTPDQSAAEQGPSQVGSGLGRENQAGHLDTGAIRRQWDEVLDAIKKIRRVTWSFVSVNAKVVDFDGERVLLEIATQGMADTFRRGNHAEVTRQALMDALALDVRVEAMVKGDPMPASRPKSAPQPQGASPQAAQPSTQPRPQEGRGQASRPQSSGELTKESSGLRGSDLRRAAAERDAGKAPEASKTAETPKGPAPRRSAQRDDGPPPMEEPDSDGPPMEEPPLYEPPADWQSTASKPAPAWASEPEASASSQPASAQSGPTQSAPPRSAAPAQPTTQDESASAQPATAEPAQAEQPEPKKPKLVGANLRGADLRRARNPEPEQPAEPVAKVRTPPKPPAPAPGSDMPSDDDEDLDTSSSFGQPVIESVLGGTVIAINDDSVT